MPERSARYTNGGERMVKQAVLPVFLLQLCVLMAPVRAEVVDPFNVEGLHGQFSIRGAVAHSACSITLDSVSQTIDFDDIPLSRFSRPGAEVASVPFSIRVENCALPGHSRQGIDAMNNVAYAGGYTVLARFYGTPVDKEHPDLLGSDTGIAGVGLRLQCAHCDHPLPVNRLTDPLPLFKGNGALSFRASLIRYDRAQEIRTGDFAWNVTFEILYQ